MTKVDFYILKDNNAMNRDTLACRLAEKAYQQQHHIYLHTQSQQDAQRLDDLLWTFNQGSFLPHDIVDTSTPSTAPIKIGFGETTLEDYDVLINLGNEVPKHFSRFTRIAELVDANESARQQARERFRFYRDRGYPLESHEL